MDFTIRQAENGWIVVVKVFPREFTYVFKTWDEVQAFLIEKAKDLG